MSAPVAGRRAFSEPRYIVLLALLLGSQPVATDLYLPALPAIAAELGNPALTLTGLIDRFSPHIFSAEQVARGKPAPDLFLLAAATMGVRPEACWVIEDSRAGIEAAGAAGMMAIGFSGGSHCRADHGERLRQAGATRVLASMDELTSLLAATSR